jgi:asparagine synthase (glutamine-hydrolysing)
MEIGPGLFKDQAYWSILNAPIQEHFSAGEARSKLKELLLQSVARRMVADVPVAAFLSGGIDSTAVVALMAELAASVETFNVSFKDTEFDESKYAQMVSAKFGTRHHTIITSPEKFLDEFPNALNAMDSPSGDGINTYIVAKAVRTMGIKVALSGIGADELFAGYPIFHHWIKIRKNSIFWKLPYALRKTLSNLTVGNNIRNQRISGLLRMHTPSIENVYTLLRQVNSKQSIHRLMKQLPLRSQLSENLGEMQPRIGQFPLLSQLSIAEFSGYTRQTLLRDTDQMSMSQSLEVREPFFDHELVEYVLGLPDGLKSGDKPKPLLLDTLGSTIPREIYDRPKKGFVLPFENWFRNELRSFCADKVRGLSQRGFFKEKELHNYWDDFLHQRNTVRWTNIMLLVSLEHYLQAHDLEV